MARWGPRVRPNPSTNELGHKKGAPVSAHPFRIELHSAGDREAIRSILEDLPEWFGRPESTEEYVKAADRLSNYFALSLPLSSS